VAPVSCGSPIIGSRLTQYSKSKLLIIDELGYLPLEPDAAHLFFQLISRRFERGSVLITSNRQVMEWGEVFGDQVVARAILDRLLHHSHVLTIRGVDQFSCRQRAKSWYRLTRVFVLASAADADAGPVA
jgi:DNA replication protein DnaC